MTLSQFNFLALAQFPWRNFLHFGWSGLVSGATIVRYDQCDNADRCEKCLGGGAIANAQYADTMMVLEGFGFCNLVRHYFSRISD